MDWRNANSSTIKASSTPTQSHVALLCQRNRVTSDREMDGYPQKGWQMIYTCGTVYQTLASSNTSTSTTITTALFTGVSITSRYPQSALLIRFSASGFSNDGTNELDTKFTLFVDGVARCGTGNTTGFAQGVFNAGMTCVVPVQAGVHSIDVKWAGGASPGTTIDPTVDGAHAFVSVEEVFCEDVDILSDAEGFVALAFASMNLPRVGYKSLTADFTNGGTTVPILEKLFYVSGDNSAVEIEFTGSLQSNAVAPIIIIRVDGVDIRGVCEGTITTGKTICLCVHTALNLPQGNHLIQAMMNGITSFTPATNPDWSHANMVIREIAGL
jgi:hypothetical protein